jgi:hypothetical protein
MPPCQHAEAPFVVGWVVLMKRDFLAMAVCEISWALNVGRCTVASLMDIHG